MWSSNLSLFGNVSRSRPITCQRFKYLISSLNKIGFHFICTSHLHFFFKLSNSVCDAPTKFSFHHVLKTQPLRFIESNGRNNKLCKTYLQSVKNTCFLHPYFLFITSLTQSLQATHYYLTTRKAIKMVFSCLKNTAFVNIVARHMLFG